MPEEPLDSVPRCSSRGCRQTATALIVWRNPRIHGSGGDGARVKRWAACDDHIPTLQDFLRRRDFLLRTEPIG